MSKFHLYITFLTLFVPYLPHPPPTVAASTPTGPLVKHLSSILKWTKNSPSSTQSDGSVVQFESGYLVETVVEGNAIGVVPYSIKVDHDGELFAVDSENSNVFRITPPLSQYSRGRLVAGSFQGKTGHVDGKPSDARFSHPKGVAMDDKGNVYIADSDNLAIRKVGEGGVTTIAGGKSNIPGYRDGPSEDAKFSTDFDLVYVPSMCSLLVVDRGNAALRQISLNHEDCDTDYSSISASDIVMVIVAIFAGYASCLLHQGLGTGFFSNYLQPSASDVPQELLKGQKNSILETAKEQVAVSGWPSFRQMTIDLSKPALESLRAVLVPFIPSCFNSKKGLSPLKDTLNMPADEIKVIPQLVQKQRTLAPLSEFRQAYTPDTTEKCPEAKAARMRSATMKGSSTSKHRSSKRPEYSEFYGSSEAPHHSGQTRSKVHKERKHRHRDKSGEVSSGPSLSELKPEFRPINYSDPRFNPYNAGNRYMQMPDGPYRY